MKIFQKLPPRWWELLVVLITAVVTAVVVYIRTVEIEKRKILFDQRKYAYAEFFEGTAKNWRANKLLEMAEKETDISKAEKMKDRAYNLYEEYELLWDKARLKMSILSYAEVIRALASHLERPEFKKEKCASNYDWDKDLDMYIAIRREMEAQGNVLNKDMILVLFDCILEK
jgi:hypothetical protein